MTRHNLRILLVYHQPAEAMALWQSLTESRQARVQVDVVPSLAQATAHLAARPVQAVVLELNLPDSRGLATLHAVRAWASDTPIIVVAEGATAALREAALAAGAEEVYDRHDVNSGLVSHSVLYVMERHRQRQQHARLQLLLETVPEAVVVADTTGCVRFANPAAQTLFGHPDAAPVGEWIDFSAPLDVAAEVLVCQGLHTLRCEVRLAAVEWDGVEARLASVRPLGHQPDAVHPAGPHREPATRPHNSAQHRTQAARLKEQALAALSQQISTQMHAVRGLHDEWEHTGLGPLQSCYSLPLQARAPLLAALRSAVVATAAAPPNRRHHGGR